MFKKGDRVKFLNDIGGGIVTRVDRKTAYVENEDGFEVPVAMSQLLPAEVSKAESSPFTSVSAWQPQTETTAETFEPLVEKEKTPDYIDISGTTDESNNDASVSILLAWIPQLQSNRKTAFDVYLINDCSYYIMYVAAMFREGTYRGVQAGTLESETKIHIAQLSADDLKHISSLRLEILFFKKGLYLPQEPMQYDLKINEFYIQDAINYEANEYFDEKALIFNISEEFLMAEIEKVALDVQMKFIKQKQQIDKPLPKPTKKMPENDTEEVDLHIEQLVDDYKSLSPAEMLDIQTKRFTSALDEAIRNRKKRIVFIHGVGNGRLRLEIQRILQRSYPKLRFQDASFKEYGFGATLIFCK